MPDPRISLDSIDAFLAQKRFALVGMSRDPRSITSILFKEFARRGYDVVPVNPSLSEAMGRRCFARLQDVQPPISAVLLLTSPEVTDSVVRDCAASGVKLVWMYKAGGRGAVSETAIDFCRQQGIAVIPGECPLMFLPRVGGIHLLHHLFRKLTGRYPRHAHA